MKKSQDVEEGRKKYRQVRVKEETAVSLDAIGAKLFDDAKLQKWWKRQGVKTCQVPMDEVLQALIECWYSTRKVELPVPGPEGRKFRKKVHKGE